MEEDPQERHLNLHLDPEKHLAGVYANFANVSFSDYEFTITFARIEHEVDEGEIPGAVVARVNMSPRGPIRKISEPLALRFAAVKRPR